MRAFRLLERPVLETDMASLTQTTRYKRKLRAKRAGRRRKNDNVNKGTTPKFAVHTAEADANAPADQLSKKS